MTIPKCVYTFWHDDTLPRDAQNCLSSVKKHNPDFEIVVLGRKDVPDYDAKNKSDITYRVLSDIVRLHFLSINGGIWLDIHCICTAPLSNTFDIDADCLQGFQTFDAAIDSYAFASPPNDPLMCEWNSQFKHALKIGFKQYCKNIVNKFALSDELAKQLPYLTIYASNIAAQDKRTWIQKKNSRDPDGPFFYEDLTLYKTCISGLLGAPKLPPLIKFDTYARNDIQTFLQKQRRLSSASRACFRRELYIHQ